MPRNHDDDFDDLVNRIRKDSRETGSAGLGVASFLIALVSGLMILTCCAVATFLALNAPGGKMDEKAPAALATGCGIITGIALSVLGIVLGIVGLTGSYSGKILAGFGLGLNVLIVLGIAGVIAFGLAVGG